MATDAEHKCFRFTAWDPGAESEENYQERMLGLFGEWLDADCGFRRDHHPPRAASAHGDSRNHHAVGQGKNAYEARQIYCSTCERWFLTAGADGVRKWNAAHDYPHDPVPLEVAPNGC